MTPVALTIAGSDPSGGAGIQADLRAFAALGVAGLSAVTALTVQNSRGVLSVRPVAPEILEAQLEAILSDTRPDAVKIGMLGGAEQVRVVAAALRRFSTPNVILDPVLASTGGVPLLDELGLTLLLSELLPLCDLVTPNTDEAARLTGLTVDDAESARRAGERLLSLGARGVLIKGGHLPGAPTDWLIRPQNVALEYPQGRVHTAHTHGTGCLLSAAIAAGRAHGDEWRLAVHGAKVTLTEALRHPVVLGQGRGYPDVAEAARILRAPTGRTHGERLARLHGLYVLTDSTLRPDRSAEQIAGAAYDNGARTVQLRAKDLPTPRIVDLARRLNQSARAADKLFLVNDRVDVALASDADGVHLGPDDMRPSDARRLLGPKKLVGVSVNSVEEAARTAPHASYFGVGAIFGSATKTDAGPPIGLGRIREIKAAFPHIPVVAIGGITAANIASVVQAGADAAAVISAVVSAPDMAAATRNLRNLFVHSLD